MIIECNADLGHPCDAGEDGEPCPECQAHRAEAMADARREYDIRSPQEKDPEQYAQDLRDAGRGHLLRPGE